MRRRPTVTIDFSRIDGAVVHDGPAFGIGLVDRFEHVVRPADRAPRSVNTATGLVTVTTAPAADVQVTAVVE
jgi:hypothetical protein